MTHTVTVRTQGADPVENRSREITVYEQRVDNLDLQAVIRAANGMGVAPNPPERPAPDRVLPSQRVCDEVLDERFRQIHEEGYFPARDDQYLADQLSEAAACYTIPEYMREVTEKGVPTLWPWSPEFWKPTPKNRRRELIKAAALLIAEIERVDRAST